MMMGSTQHSRRHCRWPTVLGSGLQMQAEGRESGRHDVDVLATGVDVLATDVDALATGVDSGRPPRDSFFLLAFVSIVVKIHHSTLQELCIVESNASPVD